jgi:hypothetical protein
MDTKNNRRPTLLKIVLAFFTFNKPAGSVVLAAINMEKDAELSAGSKLAT